MPRYEFEDGKSAKFWEVERDGESVTTRWGRIGTDGQTKTKDFPSAAAALKEVEKKTAQKVKKGYALVGGEESDASEANPELEAAITGPEDRDRVLVWADWLEEQGDPRGRLIALQDQGKEKEAAKWLKTHGAAILGPLDALGALKTKWSDHAGFEVEWERGFVVGARVANVGYEHQLDPAETIETLFAQPVCRFLRRLTVGSIGELDGELYFDEVVEAIAAAPRPSLRSLFIGDFHYSEMELSWSYVGSVKPLWKALPNLESFRLRVGNISMGPIKHDRLREFRINSGGLGSEPIKRVCEAKWPQLERLEIWFGNENYGGEGDVGQIGRILRGTGLKNLTHLGLANADFADDIAAALPKAKILPQLKSLDLSMGTMGNEGAQAILAAKERFAHLEWIDFSDNFIYDPEVNAALAGLCADVRGLDKQEGSDDDEWRYTTVGE